MPVNRNSLIRYKTIDRMLRGGRRSTLQELIDSCSDALLNYNGEGSVSRRTIQKDIMNMRYSDVLGYYAPIELVDRKYYTYSRRSYSITKIPLTVEDMLQLSEAVGLLKQMSAFNGFEGVEDVVNRLEDHIASMRYKAEQVILIDSNERLRGLKYITPLHDAITYRQALTITYKSFKAEQAQTAFFSPYILKEYNNRWFVFGKWHHDTSEFAEHVNTLALDRIEDIGPAPKEEKYFLVKSFKPKSYFKDIVGVSREIDAPVEHVVFRVKPQDVPYVRTKPLHNSQKEVETNEDGSVTFAIDVVLNKELERLILSYGDKMTVLAPQGFVDQIKTSICALFANYQ